MNTYIHVIYINVNTYTLCISIPLFFMLQLTCYIDFQLGLEGVNFISR